MGVNETVEGFCGSSGEESSRQRRGHGSDPWSWKIPHAWRQLSPQATTTEPMSHNH